MKKIALVLVLVLSLTLTFAACTNNVEKTNATVRWRAEKYLFNISKTSISGEDNDVKVDGKTFIYEPVANGYEQLPENKDEIVPEDISGTYKMTIEQKSKETWTYTTVQTLYCQYATETLKGYSVWNELQDIVVATDSEENPFTNHDGLTTLKSVETRSVTFKDKASQLPLNSSTETNGYYIGKVHQERSNYKVETEYDWENNVAKVKFNGNEQSNKLKVSSATNVIDANQLLLYTRSLEKASTNFQDSPSVQVYEPATNVLTTATFAFTHSCNTMLKVNGENVNVTVNALATIVNSSALFVQLNVPNTVNENADLDSIHNVGSGGKLNKYSLLRFRSGIMRYELADYAQLEKSADILNAIKYQPATGDEE